MNLNFEISNLLFAAQETLRWEVAGVADVAGRCASFCVVEPAPGRYLLLFARVDEPRLAGGRCDGDDVADAICRGGRIALRELSLA